MELSRDNKEELNRFRSNFKPESLDLAEKSLRLERRGAVGVIVFDTANSKANMLSTPIMLRLFELLVEIETDKTLKALVIISRKPTIFIAGADISEIQRLSQGEPGSAEALMKLQSVFTFLEHLPIPTVAAIHGACMGGGTELSLSCDYRIATDDKATKIALPEVMLGVLPGWGGTQRMPRLIGLEAALDMILTGKTVDGSKAKKMGLVDKVCPVERLEEKAVAWAGDLGKQGHKRNYDKESKHTILERVPGAKWIILDQAKKQVMKKTHGNYPAPLKILDVIGKTYGGSLEKGLKVEAEAFTELVVTPESKSLINVFYLQEGVKKDAGVAAKVKPADVKLAGVLGAGVMGGGIAQLFAAKNVRVRMKDINWDAITKGYAHAYKLFKKLVDRRRMKRSELDNAMERISATTTYEGFHDLDIVVEAVVENMEIKKKVMGELDKIVKKEGVLATNTSSLSVTEIARGAANPSRVVGMHFFNPVDKMPLVEVIRGKETTDEATATVFSLSKKLGKTPIVVKDSPGFVVNRILGPYLNEAAYLLTEGVTPRHMDKVIVAFGMPMGPAELLDEVGLDVASKVSKVLYGAFGDRMKPPPLLDKVVEEGRLGKKSGKGIYIHASEKEKEEDLDWLKSLGAKSDGRVPDEEIVKRLIYVMVNEAARCLDEELVRTVSDIDVGMIFGTGFAPFRGGLLRYADSVGADAIAADLEVLARKHGDRFKPCEYLQRLAVGKKKFYE